jgi:hypothetical protein
MKNQYVWLALTVALTLNVQAGPGPAEHIALNTGAGEEVVEPGQKPSVNPTSGEKIFSNPGSMEIGGSMAVATGKSESDKSRKTSIFILIILQGKSYIFPFPG